MSSRSGRHSRSRSKSRSRGRSRESRRNDDERPWLKRSRSRSGSSGSHSRSRSPRRRTRRTRSRSKSPPVRPVMSKDPKFVNARVFVANLASDKTSSTELFALFEQHGKVLDTLVHHNGYGFVQFSTEEEGKKAVEAENGTLFHGKKIKCNMAAERKRGGGPPGAGGGGPPGAGGGPGGFPERPGGDNRFGRDRSPLRDSYPPPYKDPYMRGRDLPPPPRDLPPPPRDMPLPPRDPFFDDPYRRPPPPDPYFDRFRDDPYRPRDPYALDPYRDPYRDPYGPGPGPGPGLFEPPPPPAAAPKKPVTVDCEVIIMTAQLRPYADIVELRLKNLNLLTNTLVIREDRTIQQEVEDATRRSCLFAIVINSQNEFHRSLTLNILHGVAQEHRNMPLDDALSLIARSFEKFLQAEKEKVAASLSGGGGGGAAAAPGPSASMPFLIPPKEIAYLLNLLADNRQLTVSELDKVIIYLKERKDKLVGTDGPFTASVTDVTAKPVLAPTLASAPPPAPAPTLQQQQFQQQQDLQHQQQQHQQQQQQQQHQELQNKILSMMNGSSAPAASVTMATSQNTMATHAAPLMPGSMSVRPPPPPTQQQQTSTVLTGMQTQASFSKNLLMATSPPSVSAVQAPAPAATLINFDNPSVQKALDNLIQSGPNLLRNITVSQSQWSGQGATSTSTVSQAAAAFPLAGGQSQQQQQRRY